MKTFLQTLITCLIFSSFASTASGYMTGEKIFDVKVKTDSWLGMKKGNNIIFIYIKDADGKPVEGAEIGIKPWMPEMGHGTPYTSKITDLGSGKYRTNVPLTMAGYWEITFTITAEGKTDSIKMVYEKVKE